MLHVYTGNGKGKTTAALGLAFRASGHGKHVLIVQFMKGETKYGEISSSEHFPNLTIVQFGRPQFVNLRHPSPEDIELAKKGLAYAKEAIESKKYGMIILDEINVALHAGLVSLADVLQLIEKKPEELELVFTGRWASEKIIEKADYVTEMKEIKHPFRKGFLGRMGVEW